MNIRNILFNTLLISILLVFFASCDNNDDDDNGDNSPNPTPGEMKVNFNYVFGMTMEPWELGKTMVHPRTKDSLNFSTFKFYLSNIKLQKQDGSWWEETESYRLIDASFPASSQFTISDIPAGTYTAIKYTLGVDSTKNVSGAQTGALSPSEGMFWDWNNGYIMLKAEGTSPQSEDGSFVFHLGGFSGENNLVTERESNFDSESIQISGNQDVSINFTANPAQLWHSSPSVSERSKTHMPGEVAKTMATDFFLNVSYSGKE